jgi:hypothetical protein
MARQQRVGSGSGATLQVVPARSSTPRVPLEVVALDGIAAGFLAQERSPLGLDLRDRRGCPPRRRRKLVRHVL